jgi:phage major head subunit gpT-like protein
MAQDPIRTAADTDALFYAFDLRFQAGLRRVAPWWSQVAQEVPSSGALNKYPWLADFQPLKQWVTERTIENIALRSYSLSNLDWEKTIGVPRNAILDDLLGVYGDRFEHLGYQASKLPDDLIASAIKGGGSATTYDGQAFFSTAHPVNPDISSLGTQSNNVTSAALSYDTYWAQRDAFRALKGEDGREMGLIPDLLVVPPQLEKTAKAILEGEMIIQSNTASPASAAAPSNVAKNTARVLVIDQLSANATTWYLMCTQFPIKPFIFQNRQSPVFTQLTAPTDMPVFMRKEFLYGVDARGNSGYGLWFMAMQCAP